MTTVDATLVAADAPFRALPAFREKAVSDEAVRRHCDQLVEPEDKRRTAKPIKHWRKPAAKVNVDMEFARAAILWVSTDAWPVDITASDARVIVQVPPRSDVVVRVPRAFGPLAFTTGSSEWGVHATVY